LLSASFLNNCCLFALLTLAPPPRYAASMTYKPALTGLLVVSALGLPVGHLKGQFAHAAECSSDNDCSSGSHCEGGICTTGSDCHEEILSDVAGSPHPAGGGCTLPSGHNGEAEEVVHTITQRNTCTGAITSSEFTTQICVPDGSGPECTSDAECGAGQACQGGRCVRHSGCSSDADCGSGLECHGGVCGPPSDCHFEVLSDVAGSPHPAGGGCTLPSGNNGAIEESEHTVTQRNTCTGAITTSHYTTQSCVPDGSGPECRTDAECGSGRVCQSGRCVGHAGGCSSNADCSSGQQCVAGTCTTGPSCQVVVVSDVAGSPHPVGGGCTLPSGHNGGIEEVVHTITQRNTCTGAITTSEFTTQICVPDGSGPECTTDAQCGARRRCQSGRCVG
jgi:Cys-rich repeat protein